MSDLALVTCRVLPEPDPDQEPLIQACLAAGLSVEMAAWDDPLVDWSRFQFAKLHSCWNYYEDPNAFIQWLEVVKEKTTLWNAADTARWNLDKRYLTGLEQSGVPIVPTKFLSRRDELAAALEETKWDRFVVKPTVSAASYMTRRFSRDQINEAEEFVSEIAQTRDAMVQPYIESVERGGEVAVIHIDGALTHCVKKEPRFSGHDESVSVGFQPSDALAEAAYRVMRAVTDPWLYARVDLMQDAQGRWLLSELELLEPTLFLVQHPPALARLVSALQRIAKNSVGLTAKA